MVAKGSSSDEYVRRARYLPGLVALAPVGVVIVAGGWQDARLVTVLAGAAVSIGAPLVLQSFVRHQGVRYDVTELEGSDGRWTTTRMLWPQPPEAPDAARNAEYRRVVERATQRTLPDTVPPGVDGAARVAAVLDESVAVVRSLTRDEQFRMLHDENAEYGMWRNLRGVRSFGLATAGLAAAAAAVLIGLALGDVIGASAAELVVGLVVVAAIGAFWWWVPTDARVHQASRRYALALFDAARLVGSVAAADAVRAGEPAVHAPTGDEP